jgi:hypothetical protein
VADPALRETVQADRVSEQSENAVAENSETAGESLEAASFRGGEGLVPVTLAAEQNAGMKGGLFLAAAGVFFTVRRRMLGKKAEGEETEGTEGRG